MEMYFLTIAKTFHRCHTNAYACKRYSIVVAFTLLFLSINSHAQNVEVFVSGGANIISVNDNQDGVSSAKIDEAEMHVYGNALVYEQTSEIVGGSPEMIVQKKSARQEKKTSFQKNLKKPKIANAKSTTTTFFRDDHENSTSINSETSLLRNGVTAHSNRFSIRNGETRIELNKHLSYLFSENKTYHNTKLYYTAFFEVFSVRPPPILFS